MIKSIDHIVLTAQDIEQTISFYCDVLGMQLEAFSPPDGSPERQALKFGNQKINLHDAQAPYIPHAKTPTPRLYSRPPQVTKVTLQAQQFRAKP